MRSEPGTYPNQEQSVEIAEKKLGKILNFFEMSPEEEALLKNKIENSGGLVRVFVHPDFEAYSEFEITKNDPAAVKKLKETELGFRKILSSKSEKLPPIIILQSAERLKDYEKKSRELKQKTANDLYLIRTEDFNPNPLPPSYYASYTGIFSSKNKPSDEDRKLMWEKLIDKFKKLGIRKIIIGGVELYVSTAKDAGHAGCLGHTINKLKKLFEIEVSTLTWPEGRNQMRK